MYDGFMYVAQPVLHSVKDVRIEDFMKFFMTHKKNNSEKLIVEDNNDDKNKKEKEKNEEYLLFVHSNRIRTRNKEYIMKDRNEEIAIIDSSKINIYEDENTDNDKKIIKVLKQIDHKNKIELSSISFSGGGYNCVYHIGVLKYIFENPELFKNTKYLGASGGAGIIAVLLSYENDPNNIDILDKIIEFIIDLGTRNIQLSKQVEEYSKMLFDYVTKDRFNKYIKTSNRCYISVTDVTYIVPINTIKHEFETYEKFKEILQASACIPFLLDDKIRKVDSRSYLDGGISNNMPVLDEYTLKISCLNYPFMDANLYPDKTCDIKHSFIPPPKEYIIEMYNQGYSDIKKYMKKRYDIYMDFKKEKELEDYINNFVEDPSFLSD